MITDHDDLHQLQAAIYAVLDELEKRADDFAKSRSIIEHAADRRKQLLARCVQNIPGKAVNERESQARASVKYDEGLTELEQHYYAAEKAISIYFLRQARLEALRSILSMQKSLVGL
jgi:hypothetical protein